ncbi:hypothetical protein HID58_044060 [Brassica napus]|uniref:Uncharacterized protein n=1 Tax=Brassica napus TaxID=3708 RepID=A0ABQ8BIA5_BRANA|nr:hypothetical protein HID58_044060 [Brassica napus]
MDENGHVPPNDVSGFLSFVIFDFSGSDVHGCRLKYLKCLSFSLTTPLIQSLNYTYLSYHLFSLIIGGGAVAFVTGFDIVYREDLLCPLTLSLEWLDHLGDHKEAYMKNLFMFSALGSLSISFICR